MVPLASNPQEVNNLLCVPDDEEEEEDVVVGAEEADTNEVVFWPDDCGVRGACEGGMPM